MHREAQILILVLLGTTTDNATVSVTEERVAIKCPQQLQSPLSH